MFDKILDHLNMSNLRQKETAARSQNSFHNIENEISDMNKKLDILIDLIKTLVEQNNNKQIIVTRDSYSDNNIKENTLTSPSFIPSINIEGKTSKANVISHTNTNKNVSGNVDALRKITGE